MKLNETLIAFITEEILSDAQIKMDAQEELLYSGLVDSMGMMRIVRFVEKTYKIDIPFEDMTVDNFKTVNSLSNYILSKSD